MGGPCHLVTCKGKQRKGRCTDRQALACTDNFQIRPFVFNGSEWFSVEQCYQAMKFTNRGMRDRLRLTKPKPKEDDTTYSLRLWDMGQRKAAIRPDWDSAKVNMMYRIVAAKYAQHADLRADLLSTGDGEIVGCASTSWKTKSGKSENWSTWNGIIQMRIREELRAESERTPGLLKSLVDFFVEAGFEKEKAVALEPVEERDEAKVDVARKGQEQTDRGHRPQNQSKRGKHNGKEEDGEEVQCKEAIVKLVQEEHCSDSCRLCQDCGVVGGVEGTCPLCDGLGLAGM